MHSIIIGTFGYGFGLRPKAEGFVPSATALAKNFAFGRPLFETTSNSSAWGINMALLQYGSALKAIRGKI